MKPRVKYYDHFGRLKPLTPELMFALAAEATAEAHKAAPPMVWTKSTDAPVDGTVVLDALGQVVEHIGGEFGALRRQVNRVFGAHTRHFESMDRRLQELERLQETHDDAA